MSDPYALGLSADKLWSPEELGAARIAARGQACLLEGENAGRPHQSIRAHDVGFIIVRNGGRIAISFGALCVLLIVIYALSPGGAESVLNTLAIAALTLVAAVLFRIWDELRLLWLQNRE